MLQIHQLLVIFVCVSMTSSEPKKKEISNITTGKDTAPEFSFPPNNTPVSKVYVFGRPIYVRQPFVLPQRDAEVVALPGTPGFAPLAKRGSGYDEPAPADEYQPAPAPAPEYQNTGYGEAPPKPKYPLPQCYTNKAGFMCCNKDLEELMDKVYDDLSADGNWKNCNTQKIANSLQDKCQEKFGTDFEAITGVGDFASKAHFYSDLICKTEKEGRTMLAYATPNRHNKPQPEYPQAPYFTVRI